MIIERILFGVVFLLFVIALFLNFTMDLGKEILNIKPISYVQYFGFFAFALGLYLVKGYFEKFPKRVVNILVIIGFLGIMATFFEALWSFNYWFATYNVAVLNGSPAGSKTLDGLTYSPSPDLRDYYFYSSMSLNQSAKKNVLFFFMSVYFVFFILNIKKF